MEVTREGKFGQLIDNLAYTEDIVSHTLNSGLSKVLHRINPAWGRSRIYGYFPDYASWRKSVDEERKRISDAGIASAHERINFGVKNSELAETIAWSESTSIASIITRGPSTITLEKGIVIPGFEKGKTPDEIALLENKVRPLVYDALFEAGDLVNPYRGFHANAVDKDTLDEIGEAQRGISLKHIGKILEACGLQSSDLQRAFDTVSLKTINTLFEEILGVPIPKRRRQVVHSLRNNPRENDTLGELQEQVYADDLEELTIPQLQALSIYMRLTHGVWWIVKEYTKGPNEETAPYESFVASEYARYRKMLNRQTAGVLIGVKGLEDVMEKDGTRLKLPETQSAAA